MHPGDQPPVACGLGPAQQPSHCHDEEPAGNHNAAADLTEPQLCARSPAKGMALSGGSNHRKTLISFNEIIMMMAEVYSQLPLSEHKCYSGHCSRYDISILMNGCI